MIDKVEVEDCSICKACYNICPKEAIVFSKKHNTFYYPTIDVKKCIHCNLCEKTCPSLHQFEETTLKKCYALQNKNDDIRKKSTSGGVFFELANYTLNQKGYVCGCIMDENHYVHHIISNKVEDIDRMMGSKYVQSDIKYVYKKIKELLESKKQVLFTGCPCQVAGLKNFLNKNYDNLICMDIICHGITSQNYLDSYISFVEKKYSAKIEKINFRDKKYGHHCSSLKIIFNNHKQINEPITINAYMKSFLDGFMLKDACYKCKYKKFKSLSDITVGDFWGFEVFGDDDNKGTSAVIINTKKGENIIKQCQFNLLKVNYDDIYKYNESLEHSANPNRNNDDFKKNYGKYGFEGVYYKYLKEKNRELIRRILYQIINKIYLKIYKQKKYIYYK